VKDRTVLRLYQTIWPIVKRHRPTSSYRFPQQQGQSQELAFFAMREDEQIVMHQRLEKLIVKDW
jgi:hypothetical protein